MPHMTHAPAGARTTRTRRSSGRVAAAAAALAVAAAMVVPLAAFAADGPYAIDGVIPDGGTTEIPDSFGNVKELGPLNSSTTKIGVIHNDAVPTLGLTNPNAQVDLRRAWLDTERDSSAPHHDWLYFAWERDSNSGSGFIAYEFMQNKAPTACDYDTASDSALIAGCNPWANRTAGDFMILWDQQGNSLDLYLRTWTGTAPNLTLGAPTLLDDAVSQAAYSADGFRGEAAVDLTATIFGGSTACKTFANTIPSTVTGNSDTADYKDTILETTPPITNCTSTTVTTPKDSTGAGLPSDGLSIGTGVVGVKDSAVVDIVGGTATPAGSVSFSLCKLDGTAVCTSGGTSVGSTNLSGAAYPVTVVSPTAYVTSAGRYCWRATFSGDTANGIPGSSDSRDSECFTVNPVTPILTTTAGPGVNLGQTVSDSASLTGTATQPADPIINLSGTGGAPAGGTITFKLFGPGNCTTLAYTSAGVTVSGDGTYNTPNPQFTPLSAGIYHWVAVYSGSSPNTSGTSHNTACGVAAENVVVSTVASSMSTAQTWVPNDSATVTAPAGSGNLAGTVSFTLYTGGTCTGIVLYGPVTRAVSGAASGVTVSTSNATSVSESGTFSWKVSYASTNPAQEDISPKCHETSALTIANGGTVSSP